MLDSLIAAFSGPGRWFMYLITILFAYGLAIALERIFTFWIRWNKKPDKISLALHKGDLVAAEHAALPHPVAALIAAGSKAKSGKSAWDAMAVTAPLVELRITRRLAMLRTIANISTMLGLLGTVYGMVYALQGLEQATTVERTARLSQGISTAMITTAWGLLAAIPALGIYAILSAKAKEFLSYCESVSALIALQKQEPDEQ